MKCSRYSPSSASMICSSWPVPSVVTTSAWVSPRVNSAEPWARGRMPTSATIGRTVLVSRPSMRLPGVEDALRTTSASRLPNCRRTRPGRPRRPRTASWPRPSSPRRSWPGGPASGSRRKPRPACGMSALSLAATVFDGFRRIGQRQRLLGAMLGQLDDRVDHRLERAMGEHHGAEHDLFGKLLGFGLDHQHAFLGAGDDEVERTRLELDLGRVQRRTCRRYSRRAPRRSDP
jgi:hypothetical protein